jgi:hypothetical protein
MVWGGGGLRLKTWNADLKQILIIFGVVGYTLEKNSKL